MLRAKQKKFACELVRAVALVAFLWTTLLAQIDVGRVAGTVKDPAGAVVAGAQITLTNQATSVVQQTQTSSTGTYVFASVLPGMYTLKAEATGFKTYLQQDVEVHVQKSVTADISVSVGTANQEVTVESAVPLLQAEDTSVGQTVGSAAINDLPLNGRNYSALAQLVPGSYFTGTVNSSPSGSNAIRVMSNGAEPGQVDFRMNGVDNNEEVFGGTTVAPPPDAIQEFQVQGADNSAEFGHSAGTVVNAIVKSGTNQIKGDLWEFFRNEALNANDYFSNQNNLRRQEYRQNQFGGTIGGPVVLPGYRGKNKTFFFFDFQRTQAVAVAVNSPFTDTIPTALMQSSGFTNLQDLITGNSGTEIDGLGRKYSLGTVFDPATTRTIAAGATDPVTGLVNSKSTAVTVRDPFFAGSVVGVTDYTGAVSRLNLIPASRIDANAVKLLQLLPLPTRPGLQNNYFAAPLQHTNINQYDARIDHNLGAKDSLFGVFSRSTQDQSPAQPFPNLAAGGALQIQFATTQPTYLLAISESHIFSPTFLNEARVGLNHNYNTREIPTANTSGLPGQFGIQGIPQLAGNGGLPTININGFSAFGSRRFSPTLQTTKAQDYTDNLTKLQGNHEIKLGIQFDRISGDITQPAFSRGNFSYTGQYSDIPNQNTNLVGIADFLLVPTISSVSSSPGVTTFNNLGGPSSYNGSNFAGTNYSANYFGPYVQDRWKLTPSLTLTLGLRWDYFAPYSEDNGRQANFVMSGGNGSSGTYYIAQAGCNVPRSAAFNSLLFGYNIQISCVSGSQVNKAQKTNFAPRVGFAYRVLPRLVVRGAYGISYGAFDSVGYGGTLGTNYPFQYTINSPNTTALAPPVLANGQTASIENTFGSINLQDPTQLNPVGLALSGKQYDYQTPYIQSLNLTTQYQFTDHDSIQIGYVGTLGRHLDALGVHNSPTKILPPGTNQTNFRPFPNLAANSQFLSPNANSAYHSLQSVYEHRFGSDLSILANYTYGKCMSNDVGKGELSPSSYRAEWLPGFGTAADYSICQADATHLLHVAGEYSLPFGKDKRFFATSPALANVFIGGWQFNYIFTYQSGQPFTVGCPTATTSDFGCNANLVPGQDPYAGPHNQTQWLNPSAFAQPAVATQLGQTDYSVLGSKPGQVRGPSFRLFDASMFKQFSTSEHTKLEFRVEGFNILNTAIFGNPGQLNFNNKTSFSRITSLRSNPRVGQLALKFYF